MSCKQVLPPLFTVLCLSLLTDVPFGGRTYGREHHMRYACEETGPEFFMQTLDKPVKCQCRQDETSRIKNSDAYVTSRSASKPVSAAAIPCWPRMRHDAPTSTQRQAAAGCMAVIVTREASSRIEVACKGPEVWRLKLSSSQFSLKTGVYNAARTLSSAS